MRQRADQASVGLDLNATRARAASGGGAQTPRPLRLDGDRGELPLFLSLERRHAEVGRPGLALVRRLPHLVCGDFLHRLGTPHVWAAGRHTLDALQATALVCKHLAPAVQPAQAVVLALPAYLTRPQAVQLARTAEQARWPVVGTLTTPLAAALAAYQQQPWSGPAVVADVDEHALTFAVLIPEEGRVQVLERETCPHLGLRVWKERLLDAVAERCIRRSRRDPRDSGETEQALYEQLDGVCAASAQGKLADLSVQAGQWYHDLVLRPEEVIGFAARLTAQALEALRQLLGREVRPAPCALILTAAAGRLPGLAAALHEAVDRPTPEVASPDVSDDFGENLLPAHTGDATVTVLPEDAVARIACELTAAFQHGQVQRGHLDNAAPLPRAAPPSRRFGTIA